MHGFCRKFTIFSKKTRSKNHMESSNRTLAASGCLNAGVLGCDRHSSLSGFGSFNYGKCFLAGPHSVKETSGRLDRFCHNAVFVACISSTVSVIIGFEPA